MQEPIGKQTLHIPTRRRRGPEIAEHADPPQTVMSFSISVLVMADAPAPLDILFLRTERSEGAGASGAPRRNGDAAT